MTYLNNNSYSAYFFKNTPEHIIKKTSLYNNLYTYNKYKNCDIGSDIIAIKDDIVYFI